MTNQIGFPFVTGSRTSENAAKRVKGGKAEDDRAMILDAIRKAGARGMTDPELQSVLKMGGSTQRPRRNELAGNGVRKSGRYWPRLICHSGERRNGAAVWVTIDNLEGE